MNTYYCNAEIDTIKYPLALNFGWNDSSITPTKWIFELGGVSFRKGMLSKSFNNGFSQYVNKILCRKLYNIVFECPFITNRIDYRVIYTDYYFPDKGLIIELDLDHFHNKDNDDWRDNYLKSLGLTVIRIDKSNNGKSPEIIANLIIEIYTKFIGSKVFIDYTLKHKTNLCLNLDEIQGIYITRFPKLFDYIDDTLCGSGSLEITRIELCELIGVSPQHADQDVPRICYALNDYFGIFVELTKGRLPRYKTKEILGILNENNYTFNEHNIIDINETDIYKIFTNINTGHNNRQLRMILTQLNSHNLYLNIINHNKRQSEYLIQLSNFLLENIPHLTIDNLRLFKLDEQTYFELNVKFPNFINLTVELNVLYNIQLFRIKSKKILGIYYKI